MEGASDKGRDSATNAGPTLRSGDDYEKWLIWPIGGSSGLNYAFQGAIQRGWHGVSDELQHDEIRELLGAYVVDALADEHERAAVEEHLRSCDDCQAEVVELRAAAERLREERAEWDQTSDALWERIRSEVRRRPRRGGDARA